MSFERKNVDFEKNFNRLEKVAFYMSWGTSWWNYFCSVKTFFSLKFSGFECKHFRYSCLRVPTNYLLQRQRSLRLYFSAFVISFLLFSGLWARYFHSFDNFFPAGLSKMHFESHEKVLREYTSFEETCYLYRFSQTLSEVLSNFHKKLACF